MGIMNTKLIKVWIRNPGEVIEKVSLAHNADFQVVVDVRAGYAPFALGSAYVTGIVIRDLTAGNVIATNPAAPISGAMGDANWPAQANQFVYTVPAANLGSAVAYHLCQVVAFLSVGVVDPDVSFGTSPMFIARNP